MRVSIVYPSTGQATGGETVLYDLANALAERGIETHFLHGPAWPSRVASLDELPEMCSRSTVIHHLVDSFDDPSLPSADVVLNGDVPRRLGLPMTLIQGHRLLSEEFEREAWRQVGLRLCVATWLRDIGARYGVPRELTRHVPPGIDHDRFALRTPFTDRPIDVALMYHPYPEKGWGTALPAIERVLDERPTTRVVVFGRRPPPTLPAGVEFVDSPDQARLAEEIYGRARVFVQASRNEGFGLTPLEAMACGAALVSTDCGGSRDYAFPDETALVVAPDAPDALAAAMLTLLDDEGRRLTLARAGEALARTFTWARTAERFEAHVREYLADPDAMLVPPLDDGR